ncbi:hypothetical protein [Legionella sp. km772]|uniref:hypothetical protein n=1 Tax=Legionella sp. km772 TaxID=2498111 RepID=UPI000F8C3098|nr:hypothetical protein [Legionella sp. km772]RUR07421.1 hypothetical protein ELY15_12225 [Legionella sp. km772]
MLKTELPRKLATGNATPVITLGHNSFGQPTRLTHHKNPFEKQAYLTLSLEDQTYLTGYNTRGLQVVTVDPEGAIHSQSFTETKKLALDWIWVKGWRDGKLIRRLHQTRREYNERGLEILRIESIETGSTIKTTTRSNAFGEKIAEGYGDDYYPLYWLRDNQGEVWNTNEQNGVPLITLRNLAGYETLNLRSRTRALKDINSISKLKAIIDLDYTQLQRVELQRDLLGRIEAQALPAFKSLPIDAPEPLPLAVSSGTNYPSFGSVSLTWPLPEIAGLEAEVSLWPKGGKKEKNNLKTKNIGSRCGVDVSMLFTDDYEYQIDFYYRDPQNKQRDAHPSYRAEGSSFIITKAITASSNLVWQQIDEQRLMVYGNLSNVSGIELRQRGKVIGRVSLSSTNKAHCWLVDLSDKPSGKYEFHWLRNYSLLEAKPLKIGAVSSKGSRLDNITTVLAQELVLVPALFNAYIISTWKNLPPQLSNLHHEIRAVNTYHNYPSEETIIANYKTEHSSLVLSTKAQGRSYMVHNSFYPGTKSFSRFSVTVVKNRLFTIDSNNTERTIAEVINPNSGATSFNSSFLYVQPGSGLAKVDALREHFSDGREGKIIALSSWINNSSRCPSSAVNAAASYDLVSLKSALVEPNPCGQLNIHTANTRSKDLMVREINLSKVLVSKIKPTIDFLYRHYHERQALNFKWILPGFLENQPIKIQFKLNFHTYVFKKTYGDHLFEYEVGRSSQMPYNGHLIPIPLGYLIPPLPKFSDFDLKSLKIFVQYNNDWILLLDSNDVKNHLSHAVENKTCATAIKVNYPTSPKPFTHSIKQYKEGDTISFENAYTLIFYPLPEGIDPKTIQLQYNDNSLSRPDWRPFKNVRYTGHVLSISAAPLTPGSYQYRLKAKNIKGQLINFSELAPQIIEGWAVGQFDVTHGGSLSKVSRANSLQDVVQPIRRQSVDRWGNLVSNTNTLGATTLTQYNARNKALQKIEPAIEITDEKGQKETINPKTRYAYDLNDNTIALTDPNGYTTYHERDNDGKVLKTILGDGNFKQFIPDIFGQTSTISDPLKHNIYHKHDRCNRDIARKDACGWETKFANNDLGDRLSVSNGNQEVERYDYLHPLRLPTHHYMPGGETHLTRKEYDRRGVIIREIFPDQRENKWKTDDFGNPISHTDLGGAVYTYQNNSFYPTEITQITSSGGKHGFRLFPDGSTKAMANQDLRFQYDEASHEVAILDNALPLTTQYRYDLANRRARGKLYW